MTSDTEDAKKMAGFFQSQMRANFAGLDDHHPPSAFQRETGQLRNGTYEMATSSWIADFADPVNYVERFHTDINRGNYSFMDVDELIDSAKAAYNDEEARWDYLGSRANGHRGTLCADTYLPVAGTYLLKAG